MQNFRKQLQKNWKSPTKNIVIFTDKSPNIKLESLIWLNTTDYYINVNVFCNPQENMPKNLEVLEKLTPKKVSVAKEHFITILLTKHFEQHPGGKTAVYIKNTVAWNT